MDRPTTHQRPTSPIVEVLLLGLLPLSALAFGGVHTWPRIVLTTLVLLVGVHLVLRSRYVSRGRLVGLFCACLAVSALPLLPVPASVRAALMGPLAAPVQQVLDLAGETVRPLALDPWAGLLGWVEAVALVLLGCGVAGWGTRAGRVRRLLWVTVGAGAVVVVLMLLHMGLSMDSIYGTGVGSGHMDKFFGPFVNPNHGGIFAAAILPLALTRCVDGGLRERLIGVSVAVLLGLGVWLSGSRGAVVASGLGCAATIAAVGGRRIKIATGGTLAFVGVSVLAVGPKRALEWLSSLVAPGLIKMVDAGYVDLTTGRAELLTDTLQIIGAAPILGVGPGGFRPAFRMVRSGSSFTSSSHAHNEYLQLFAEHGGLVGVLALVALALILRIGLGGLASWSHRPDRRWLMSGWLGTAVALAVASSVDFPLRLLSHAILASLALGILVGLARPQRGGASIGIGARRGVWGVAALAGVGLIFVAHGTVGPWASGQASQSDGEAWVSAIGEGAERDAALDAAAGHFSKATVRGMGRKSFQWLAQVRVAQGQYAAAEAVLAAGTGVDPTMSWLWRDRARLAQRMGKGDLARTSWARMLAVDLPPTADPLDVMHEAFFGGEFEEPIEQARAILPERADRYRQAALVMDQLGLIEESESLFRHALSMEESRVFHYAAALKKWGRPQDAVMLLEVHRPGCNAKTLYATSLLAVRRYTEAAAAYVDALSGCGASSWELRQGICHARLLAGDPRGEGAVEELLEERPESHKLRRVWLWVLSRRGRPAHAVTHLQHLKDSGVIRPVERVALERSSEGLPFVLPHPDQPSNPR